MKLIRRNLNRDHSGCYTLVPEDAEDMWYVFNLVQEGDEVQTKTMRKIVPLGRDGTPSGPGVRKLLRLKVRVEKIDFDPDACSLRLNGPVVEDVPDVSAGTYHTIQLELDRVFELYKSEWDLFSTRTVSEALDVANRSDIAAVVLQPGLAHVCLITDAMTTVRAKIERNIPRKRRGDNSQHDKAVRKFLEDVCEGLKRNIALDKVKVVLLAGPGQIARDLYDNLFKQAVNNSDSELIKMRSKFLVVNAASGHVHAIQEALAKPEIQTQLQNTRYGREMVALDEMFKELTNDSFKAWYGPKHVQAAIDRGYVRTLMLTDSLFRSSDIQTRRTYVAMVEAVRETGKETLIFSSFHPSGEQLNSVGGVACITLYPTPDLDEIELSSDSDSDSG